MERCGFFNANLVGEEYDRVYLAQHFAAYFASFIGNGVYAEHSNQLQVIEMTTPQMQIGIEKGQGWINGYWYENTDILYIPIDAADGVLNRIDSVVLRLGFSERNMWLAVKRGTPAVNPTAPEVTRTADYYELQLATISIPASSIKITQAQITDTRMNQDVCGWVTGVVKQLDTTTLFNQFETYFEEFKQLNENEFTEWFNHIKGQLSEDAAGKIQIELDNLKSLFIESGPIKLDAQVVSSTPAITINANKSKIYKTLGFAIIDVSMTITPTAPIMSEGDTITTVKMVGINALNVEIPFYFQLNVSNAAVESEFVARLQTGGTIILWPTKALIDKGGYDLGDTITVRVTGVYPLSESEISES